MSTSVEQQQEDVVVKIEQKISLKDRMKEYQNNARKSAVFTKTEINIGQPETTPTTTTTTTTITTTTEEKKTVQVVEEKKS